MVRIRLFVIIIAIIIVVSNNNILMLVCLILIILTLIMIIRKINNREFILMLIIVAHLKNNFIPFHFLRIIYINQLNLLIILWEFPDNNNKKHIIKLNLVLDKWVRREEFLNKHRLLILRWLQIITNKIKEKNKEAK